MFITSATCKQKGKALILGFPILIDELVTFPDTLWTINTVNFQTVSASSNNIPFLAFHCLDEDEEIKLFDTINTKAKGIGSSLSKFLRRDSDDISWIATELLVRQESPFYHIGSILGKRSKGRHITLQNLYRTLHLLSNDPKITYFSKEEKLTMSLQYFNTMAMLI